MKDKLIKRFVIGTFITLYTLVSTISTIHSIEFFELSNPYWLAVTLAIGFEIGAAASLASLVILKKMNKTLVWALFIVITAMQMNGNLYYAFKNLEDYQAWSQLFNLIEEDPLYQKRILAFVSGAILPLIALGFIKSLVDYIKPEEDEETLSTGQLSDPETDPETDPEMPEREPSQDYFEDIEANVEQPTREEREQILADMMARDQELGLYEDLDATLNDGLEDEEWDEDHALDLVLNDMAEDMDLEEDELEQPNEALVNTAEKYKDYINPVNNPTSVGSIVQKLQSNHLPQDEDALLRTTNRMKAEQEMMDYLKSNQNDDEATN